MAKTKKRLGNVAFTSFVGSSIAVVLAGITVGNYFALNYREVISRYFNQPLSELVQMNPDEQTDANYFPTEYATPEAALEAAQKLGENVEAEGMVLLKNGNKGLPLGQNKKVSLFSLSSVDPIFGGTGSGAIDTKTVKNLKDVLEAHDFTVNPTLWSFYESMLSKYKRAKPGLFAEKNTWDINGVPMEEYTPEVENSYVSYNDAAVLVIGRSGGEGDDLRTELQEANGERHYLELTPREYALLDMLQENSAFDRIVVLVNSPNPMELGWLEQYSKITAALWIGPVGQTGFNAVAKALRGDVNPSGRLVDTYAFDSLSSPAIQNWGDLEFANADLLRDYTANYFGTTQYVGKNAIAYQEGIYVGYRYYETRYEDKVLGQGNAGDYNYANEVQYTFGYGLSYTEFAHSNYKVTPHNDGFTVSIDVKNDGDVAGKDVVEVYMQSPYTAYDKQHGVEKSAVELVGFAKTKELKPGETQTVTVEVDKEELRAYDSDGAKGYIMDAGDYYFAYGTDAHDALNNILAAKGKTVSDGMTEAGDETLAYKWTKSGSNPDANVFKTSTDYFGKEGTEITNQLEFADARTWFDGFKYLTRSDWTGTFPKTHASLTASAELEKEIRKQHVTDYKEGEYTMPTFGATPTLPLIALRGADYNDEHWETLLDQLTKEEAITLVSKGGYGTPAIDSVVYPGTTDKDGPAGISAELIGGVKCMAYPAEVVMAATWNTELMNKVGKMIGEEGVHNGVLGFYAPAMNMHRTPFGGRNFEYYSEDPFISGAIGAAEVEGIQSKGMFTYIKHFAVNDQDTNRKGLNTFANEQTIREIYFTAFEMSIRKGGSKALMTAHSRLGPQWTAGCSAILNEILRGEWGFMGHVVTDYINTPTFQSMVQAVLAGNDLCMNTKDANKTIYDPYLDNPYVMTMVRRACHNILYTGVNSAAMNGITQTTKVVQVIPTWQKCLIALDVVVGLLAVAGVAWIVVRWLKSKKDEQ